MNKTIKRKWVKALRSGRYIQGASCLRSEDNEYCCLGVLASQMGKRWTKQLYAQAYKIVSKGDDTLDLYLDGVYLLPKSVQERAGLSKKIQESLSNKNDSGRWSFTRIADWIEKNL